MNPRSCCPQDTGGPGEDSERHGVRP
jgi:hypothetical protein